MNTISTSVNGQSLKATGPMRSPGGVWGAIVLLALLPLAALYGLFFANGFETFIHWILATGALLLALAVFDFDKLPKWLTWAGALFAGGVGTIFFLQGLSHLIQNDAFTYVVYQLLGQQLEGWLPRLFVLVWGGGLLLLDSQGKTRIFGIVALSIYLAIEVYRLSLMYLDAAPNELLKVVILLPFIWLLFESKKGSYRF